MLLSIAATCKAGENPNYRSFEEFNNDTLAYLKENFDGNEYYVGKTLGELFKNMEIEVKYYTLVPNWLKYRKVNDTKVEDAIIYFDESNVVYRALFERRSMALLKIYVSFEPMDMTEYDKYILSSKKTRDKKEEDKDNEWKFFFKPFIEKGIITKITVPDVVR